MPYGQGVLWCPQYGIACQRLLLEFILFSYGIPNAIEMLHVRRLVSHADYVPLPLLSAVLLHSGCCNGICASISAHVESIEWYIEENAQHAVVVPGRGRHRRASSQTNDAGVFKGQEFEVNQSYCCRK